MLNKKNIVKTLASFLLATSVSTNVLAEEAEERQNLFGDLGRSSLAENGVEFEAILTHDLWSNVSGGIKRDSKLLGDADLAAAFDTGKLGLWSGGTFFVYGMGLYGGDPTAIVGDLQYSSNIESYSNFNFLELWYNHDFYDGKFAILMGLYDFASEFGVIENGGGLTNSSFGVDPTFSQTVPSIFPNTSASVRVKYLPTESTYIQAALADGTPGDPNDPNGTQIIWKDSDGLLWASEVEYATDPEEFSTYEKYAFGMWRNTAEYEDYNGHERDSNQGYYLIGEGTLCTEEDGASGLGYFFQAGWTRKDRNQIGNYFGGGFTYKGLLPERADDSLNFGVAFARNASQYKDAVGEAKTAETAVELNYRATITPFFAVQPVIQFISNPGTDPALQDAWVLGIRTELAL